MAMNLSFKESKHKLLVGCAKMSDMVGITFSPSGKNIIMEELHSELPKITKDGVTIAKNIHLMDPEENLGAQALKEISIKVLDRVGDGTTTAILFANQLLVELNEYFNKNNLLTKESFFEQQDFILQYLKDILITKLTEPTTTEEIQELVKKLIGIATIASNGDEEIIKNFKVALEYVDGTGNIIIEESKIPSTKVELRDGFTIDHGFSNPLFIKDRTKQVYEHSNANILLFDGIIENWEACKYFFKAYIEEKLDEPIVIISRGIGGIVESSIVSNIQNEKVYLKFCNVTLNGTEDEIVQDFEDLSAALNVPVLGVNRGRKFDVTTSKITLNDLNKVDRIIISQNKTTIVNDVVSFKKEEQIKYLKSLLANDISSDEQVRIEKRIGRLTKKMASILVGAPTDTGKSEKKDRYEDANLAIKSALRSGIVQAGGFVWFKLWNELKRKYNEEDNPFLKTCEFFIKKLFSKIHHIKHFKLYEKNDLAKDLDFNEIIAFLINIDEKKWIDLKSNNIIIVNNNKFFEPAGIFLESITLGTQFAWNIHNTEGMLTYDREHLKSMRPIIM